MKEARFTIGITDWSQYAVFDRRKRSWLKVCQSEEEARKIADSLNVIENHFAGFIVLP